MCLAHGGGLGSSDKDMLVDVRTELLSAGTMIVVQPFELCELLVLATYWLPD